MNLEKVEIKKKKHNQNRRSKGYITKNILLEI
jgi:hypothetical protein